MQAVATTQTVNDIGQITLGEHFAGQQVTVQSVGDGAWYIQTASNASAVQRSQKRLAFLESEQAVVRTERGQKADKYIQGLRENDRLSRQLDDNCQISVFGKNVVTSDYVH